MNFIQILTTQNDVVYTIIEYIFTILEAALFCNLTIKLLKISYSKKQLLMYMFLLGVIGNIIRFFIKSPLNDAINIALIIISNIFIFKQNIKNSFLALVVSYIGIFVSSYLTQVVLVNILNIPLDYILQLPLYRFISLVMIYSFFCIFTLLITNIYRIQRIFKLSLKSTIILNLLCGILIIFIQSYIFSTYNILSFEIELIIVLSLLFYFFITMYSLVRTNKLEETAKNLESEKLYNKTLTLLHDNIRCFKHDFNNMVQVLGGYIDLNDMDGLKKYYKNLLEECKVTNNLNILNPETINNPSIYSLLTNKYYTASEKGIQMTFNIFTDLSNINFNMYEFSRILGILLDNAIEAAEDTNEKKIDIEFKSDNKKQLFIIANSCKDTNISTTKIFEKGFSTKEHNSGIGLWKVHNILAKNTNVDLFTTVNNNIFTQQLEVFFENYQ